MAHPALPPLRRRTLLAATAAFSLLAPLQGRAQAPARVVVPYPAGGPTDEAARILARELSQAGGRAYIVENRAGAGGTIGAAEVARATPDGSVLLVNASAHVIYPFVMKKIPFDVLQDVTPVTRLVTSPLMLVVSPQVEARSVSELVALARARPGRLSFASAGNGGAPHLAGEHFKHLAGVDITHVPYKGTAPALADLMGGHVDLYFSPLSSALPHVAAGKLRALGVSSRTRSPLAPTVPGIAEAGLPGFELQNWYGLWAPKNTPPAIADRLAAETAAVFRLPAVVDAMRAAGAEPATQSPAQFAEFCVAQQALWGGIARNAGLQPE